MNAGSFVCSAALVASITRHFGGTREEHERGASAGLQHIWGDAATRSLFVVWVLLYLAVDVAVVADLPISRLFGWGTIGNGLISAVIGVGAQIGPLSR